MKISEQSIQEFSTYHPEMYMAEEAMKKKITKTKHHNSLIIG